MDQAAHELISRHNEQMRELIVRDIDLLERKLNVKRQVLLKADAAMDKVKGTLGMNGTREEGATGFVRQNAAPLLAIGVGGALLARNVRHREGQHGQSTTTRYMAESSYVLTPSGSQGGDEGIKERAGAAIGDVQAKASDGLDTAKGKAIDAKDRVSEAADSVASQAVHAKDVMVEHIPSRQQASQMAHDHNQLFGLAALAAGALAGTFIPRSRAEERRIAPVQEQVKEKASELVDVGVEKAKDTADRAAGALEAAAETARDEFKDDGDDQPPSTTPSGLPDLTRPNRITGSSPTDAASTSGLNDTRTSISN